MNLSRFIFLLSISISLILIGIEATITEVSSSNAVTDGNTNQYQPLYVVRKINRYNFVDQATYDLVMDQQIQMQSNSEASSDRDTLLAACSKKPTDDRLLEIMPTDEKRIVDGYRCEEPVEFFVAPRSKGDFVNYLIGFMIYDHTSGMSSANNILVSGIPTTYFPISLIKVTLEKVFARYSRINTWHDIKYGNMLPFNQRSQNHQEYETGTSILIYGYDIDEAYKPENQSKYIEAFFESKESKHKLAKLQLAPVDDFFFDAWRRASLCNINTIPVWDTLIPEWRQLEEFIRRVAEFVGDLQIITGGALPHSVPDVEFYNPQHSTAMPIFEKIFKAISFNQKRKDHKWIRQGILFTMANDPREKYDSLDEYAIQNGWKYLENGNVIPRIRAKVMDPDTMKELDVTISYDYEPFNLSKVKKLSKNEDGEEIEIEVDVLRKIMGKYGNKEDSPPATVSEITEE
ncbi:uncharacterized protein LOC135848718 [Planococcus citri]|uniref:uncharacterized protein LOC135848718 n=1 Tax=Planococcus citri TaxID=170843 RepID=UPI0031F72FA4